MTPPTPPAPALACPVPHDPTATVQLAHGGGGRVMQRLIEDVFAAAFVPLGLDHRHDGATLSIATDRIVVTTDSFVVRPIEFPGGDIGTLAITGTVNDLAMCGATPRALTVAFVIEEGLPISTLHRIVHSMATAARAADVRIASGDTKVIDRRGGADRESELFITTSGVGELPPRLALGPARMRAGDAVIVSGDVGRHGIAVLAAREDLQLEPPITSDCAPLHREVAALLDAGIDVHAQRDCTRGGLAAALHELASAAGCGIELQQADMPVAETVQAVCELLGLDPLFVANEGRFVAIVAHDDAARALDTLRAFNAHAAIIGEVRERTRPSDPPLTMRLPFGTTRLIDLPAGELLPRIC